jgi:broad specificity phosphatase PhoE
MSDAYELAPEETTASPPPAPSSSPPVGSIVLARHGEPALSRRIKLDARAYDRWWAAYEAGGILPGQTPPEELLQIARDADVIFASTRLRAIETARALGQPFREDALFVEAPLPAPRTPAFIRLGPKAWGVITRFLWYFGHNAGQESRGEAWVRARRAADRLSGEAEAGRDVLLVAHGWFNGMVGVELTRRGWRCVKDRGFKYWSARRFERR